MLHPDFEDGKVAINQSAPLLQKLWRPFLCLHPSSIHCKAEQAFWLWSCLALLHWLPVLLLLLSLDYHAQLERLSSAGRKRMP